MVKCINLAPGFRCEPCPNGFDGVHVTGYYAQSISEDYVNQLCTGKKYINSLYSHFRTNFLNWFFKLLKFLEFKKNPNFLF